MTEHRLYKFSTINKNLIDSLLRGYLFFAKPVNLNDPFDCRIDVRKAMNNAMKIATKNHSRFGLDRLQILIDHGVMFESIEKSINESGVCSFSQTLGVDKEPLMWSHYADNHRGVRILYEIPKTFIINEIKANNIVAVNTVNYDIEPLTNLFINFANDTNDIDDNFADETVHNVINVILTSKNICWNYEKEVRMIKNKTGMLYVPKSYIKQICFGLHAFDEDISLIKEIVGNYEHKVNLCKAIRIESDFGIDYKNI